MTYKGRIENGSVTLVGAPLLAEGTEVTVLVEDARAPTVADVLALDLSWAGPPGELERLQAMVNADREASIHADRDLPALD